MENLADLFLRLSNPLFRLAFSRLGSKLESEAAIQEAFKGWLQEEPLFQAVRDLAPQRSLHFDWIEKLNYQIGTDSPVRARQPESQFTHTLQLMNAYEMGFLYYSIEPGRQGFSRVPESKLMETARFYKPMRSKHGTEVANQLYIRSASFALIRLESVPAQLKLKLWRNNPGHVTDPADVTEVLQVVE